MPAFPRNDETILSKLSDKRVYNVGQLAGMSQNGTLSFVRSPVFKHFRGYPQLFKTAKPIGPRISIQFRPRGVR